MHHDPDTCIHIEPIAELPRYDYDPQPDITAYELALLLPHFHGVPLLQASLDKLGTATRHLKIH